MAHCDNQIYKEYKERSKEPLVPFRYFVMFLVFMATSIEFSSRCILNVALLAMVGTKEECNNNETNHEIHFDWDQNDQGIALGAYFYTYTAVQIIAGSMVDRCNNVRLLAFSQFIASLCTFITPLAARRGLGCLVIVRMVLGLVHGTTFPTLYSLVDRWFSTTELSWAQSLLETGCDFGTGVTMSFTAWISRRNLWGGWPAAFYIVGIFNMIFTVVWICTVTREPQSNRFVSDCEKKLLALTVVNKIEPAKSKSSTPWLKILTSLPLWSVIISKGLIALAYYTINSKIPVYLESVLNYKLENNGLINAMFYVAIISSELISGPLAKIFITKNWLSKTTTRKLFESIALTGVGLSLLAISYLGDHPHLIIACLVVAMFSYGFVVGGDAPTIPEMAPNLIGTTVGFANTLSCASGFIAPAIIGAILGEEAGSQSKWILSFKIMAAFQIIAFIFFNLFATTDPQPWADGQGSMDYNLESREKSKESQSIETICEKI